MVIEMSRSLSIMDGVRTGLSTKKVIRGGNLIKIVVITGKRSRKTPLTIFLQTLTSPIT